MFREKDSYPSGPTGKGKKSKNPKKSDKVPHLKRDKGVKKSVILADKIAKWTITVGGIAVIAAVLGIMVFLIKQVLPLFSGADIKGEFSYKIDFGDQKTLTTFVDEYKTIALHISDNGELKLFHLKTGTQLESPKIDLHGEEVSSFASYKNGKGIAIGLESGKVWLGELTYKTDILTVDGLPNYLDKLNDKDSTDGKSIFSILPGDQFRKISIELNEDAMISVAETPIIAIDIQSQGEAERRLTSLLTLDQSGRLLLQKRSRQFNLLSGESTTEVEQAELPPVEAYNQIKKLVLHESGRMAFAINHESAKLHRYLTEDMNNPQLVESIKLLEQGKKITSSEFLLGQGSLMIAGNDGSLRAFYILERIEAETIDKKTLVASKDFYKRGTAVQEIAISQRDKSFAISKTDGQLEVIHGTSEKVLLEIPFESSIRSINLTPRLDGLLAISENGQVKLWDIDAAHPETNLKTLFGQVWYEGYSEPTFTWQSSAATDDFEPKLSLIPLIFGTLKATFYSLIFAIPLAILAAIYTSEFVSIKTRGVVKPMMELMASLPSVVLGFVAALVLAPVIESWISSVLLIFIAFPTSLMLAAYLWQLIPQPLTLQVGDGTKLIFKGIVVLISLYIAYHLGVVIENTMFEGDFKAWLSGEQSGTANFLFLMFIPLSFIVVFALFSRFFGRTTMLYMQSLPRSKAAILDIAKWFSLSAVGILVAYIASISLDAIGFDVRGGFVDTYVQRNTLVVGLAMGFAVIPIIYTLAEDALNAVPEHLRAGSLGCGATPWQTAIWIVLPTAISGVFSAVMIGMGRAVGETMIVVMSAGNTPILDANIFNGLRALSATIAVELPEAVKEGTLYRVLFLAGLVLFAMTFFINTIAEVVRIRFRKRAKQL